MSKKTSNSVQRVRDALVAAGLDNEVKELSVSTRSALEAATAVGCEVGQIVKSLAVKGVGTGEVFMVLVNGSDRLSLEKVTALVGEEVVMADAGAVREQTGFAIGGVPPLGHLKTLKIYIDEKLMDHAVIWAAAGSPNALFHLSPDDLVRITGGTVTSVTEG